MTDFVLQATKRTRECLQIAEAYYKRPFLLSAVTFDLTGQAAGMLRVSRAKSIFTIRYNRALLEASPNEILNQTVPHEVAHLVAFQQFGFGIKPHGREWAGVMRSVFGRSPDRCHSMDTSIATGASFVYRCSCEADIVVTKQKHAKIQKSLYRCKKCSSVIAFVGERESESFKPKPASNLLIASMGLPLTDGHLAKVKELLAGTEIIQAILQVPASDSLARRKIAKVLSVPHEKVLFLSQAAVPSEQVSHAIVFNDAPSEHEISAVGAMREQGVRVRLLRHPR